MPTLEEKIEALKQGKYVPSFGKEEQFANKVPEQKVEQIKQEYTTNPEVKQTSVNIEEIRDNGSKLNKPVSNTDLLLGLIPLATSVVAGGQLGEGVDVAGKYYGDLAKDTEKRQQSLEDKLLALELSRAKKASEGTKGSKRFQSFSSVDPDTKQVIMGSYDTFTGQYLDNKGQPISADKIRRGFAVIPEESDRRLGVSSDVKKSLDEYFLKGSRVSPETGLIVAPKGGKLEPVQESTGILNPKQEKDLTTLTSKFVSSDLYKKTAQTLASATNVKKLLIEANNNENAAAANSARVQIARMAGEVGALSDSDIERAGGSPSIKERARRFSNLQKTGVPLSQRDMIELQDIAIIYEKAAKMKLNSAVSSLEEDFVTNYNGVPGAVARKMRAYIPATDSTQIERPQTVKRMGPDGQIYEYKLNPKTGKYE
jgi:hypothetical protein